MILAIEVPLYAAQTDQVTDTLWPEGFAWEVSKPLISAQSRKGDDIHSIKDPTVVYYVGKWHPEMLDKAIPLGGDAGQI